MRKEAFTRALVKAIEKGFITSGEKVEIESWWESRPAAVGKLGILQHPLRL